MHRASRWPRGPIFLLIFCCWGCASGGGGTRPTTAPAVKQAPEGIENFAEVSPGIYRGAQPTREGFVELQKLGVKTVVNLRESDTDSFKLQGLGMRYVNIPCSALLMRDREVVQTLSLLADPANYPIFIHCHRGADRTGCAIAAWRMMESDWPVEEAIAEMYCYGHSSLYAQMRSYLRKLDVSALRERVRSAERPKLQLID